ncbi:hypothetical protein LguiB_021487 [Lonicera macranthoides]
MFSSSLNKHLLKLGHGCDRHRDSIMDGYVKYEEAVELINDMMNASVQADKTFWVAVISSCSSHVILALQNRL